MFLFQLTKRFLEKCHFRYCEDMMQFNKYVNNYNNPETNHVATSSLYDLPTNLTLHEIQNVLLRKKARAKL